MTPSLTTTYLLLTCLALSPQVTRADWLNLTGAETAPNIAEIYILDDHVKVALEVYVGDLELFADLVPDSWLSQVDKKRPGLEERMRRFSREQFQFVTETGDRLEGRLVLAEPRLRTDRQSPYVGMINPITRRLVPQAPDDKRVLYVEIEYPYAVRPSAVRPSAVRPSSLTIVPPVDGDNRALATIGFIAYHKAVPVIDFRYLGAPAELKLDWEDPWYSAFSNRNLKRHHKSALMSFLYVEPYEVRHEVLTRVKDLEEWMDTGLRGDQYIEIDELDALKQRVGEFFLSRNPVRIDGQAGQPILDRTNFVEVSLTGIKLIEQPDRLEISTAIIGVIITYLTDGIPQEVTVDWELFTDQIQEVPATSTDPAGPLPTYLSADDNVHTWTNFLKDYTLPTVEAVTVATSAAELRVPLITVACLVLLVPVAWRSRMRGSTGSSYLGVGAVALIVVGALAFPYARVTISTPLTIVHHLDDQRATALLEALLRNVYRSFDFREEDDVYDRLAISATGEVLADIYLENRKSFAVQAAGGAQAKVKDVTILAAQAHRIDDDSLAYELRSQWTAMGTVGHWGHVHTRQNAYDAIITIESIDGVWKIRELEVIDERRLDPSGTPAPARPNGMQ